MKILMVNKYLMPKGGAETYVFEVGKQLDRMGHQVQYFGMDHPKRIVGNRAGVYVKYMDFHSSGLAKLTYPLHIIYSREAKRKIMKVIADFQPDIVHLNNFNYQLTPSVIYGVRRAEKKLGRSVKIVLTAHDVQLSCPNHMMNNPVTHENCEKCVTDGYWNCVRGRCIHQSRLRSALGALEGWIYHRLNTYRHIDLTIYPSAFISTKLNSNPELKKRYVVLHNFVTETEPKPERMNKEDYVLYFGRFSHEKGMETLIEVCRALPQIRFQFAGSGPLEDLLTDVKNAECVGFQTGEALQERIAKARYSVLPSEWYENCPFSVLESITCHTPVIGARIGGIPELIRDGETGLLFESGNTEDLRDKISALWHDRELLERMTENCSAEEFDDVRSYCEKLVRQYEALRQEGHR